MEKIKIGTLGDSSVGKNCLLRVFAYKKFPDEYSPYVSEHYSCSSKLDGHTITLDLWTHTGNEDYESIRHLSYPQTDAFLICFNITDPATFENVIEKWEPEISRNCPRVPIILVGTQADKRSESTVLNKLAKWNMKPVSTVEALKVQKKIGAVRFVECSAMKHKGVDIAINEAIRAVLKQRESIRRRGSKHDAKQKDCVVQ